VTDDKGKKYSPLNFYAHLMMMGHHRRQLLAALRAKRSCGLHHGYKTTSVQPEGCRWSRPSCRKQIEPFSADYFCFDDYYW
jgi:hypothetical protein